jgi:hypothetical protein
MVGPKLLWEMEYQMMKIKKNLKFAQGTQKICADKGRIHMDFQVGDHVLLKVKAKRNSLKLGNFSKIVVRYYGPFEILVRIVPIAYIIALNTCICIQNEFHVSFLKKYVPNDNHVIYWNVI